MGLEKQEFWWDPRPKTRHLYHTWNPKREPRNPVHNWNQRPETQDRIGGTGEPRAGTLSYIRPRIQDSRLRTLVISGIQDQRSLSGPKK